ncbi:MAG: dihydropteroate synthase [Acidobacteriota bacterium]
MRKRYVFRARGKALELGERTRLMGILNVTPDSFSDGGRFVERDRAVEHGLRLVAEGAEILDIGGESTRPGSSPVPAEVELARVVPVIEALRPHTDALLSVDTYKAEVARAALEAGADIVNDVSGFRFDPAMPEVVERYEAGVVLMHMRGTPADMHTLPPAPDIVAEVRQGLQVAVRQADGAGIPRDRILLDPGLGFGKNAEENLVLLRRLPRLMEFDMPWLVGPSRKRFIGHVLEKPVEERLWGTAAVCAFCAWQGVHVLRVHDVGPIRQVVDMIDALAAGTTD